DLEDSGTGSGSKETSVPPLFQPGSEDFVNSSHSDVVSSKSPEDVMNLILPPLEWEEDGNLWRQQVSCTPATRLDVLNLQKQLDARIQHRQAKASGICPIRREIFSQCFDELIRQVTVSCAERGMLLVRVRDEVNMTLAAYQTLFESSCAFGIRKALQAQAGKEDLERRVEDLEDEKRKLEDEKRNLELRLEETTRLHQEREEQEKKRHEEKLDFFQHKIQQLRNQLEAVLAAKK
ncbi:unnamed protein product, partial [Darwinula stevensoni]